MSENIEFIKKILIWIKEKQIFSSVRKSNEQRVIGRLLFNSGLSYKKAGSFANAIHEAGRKWYKKGGNYLKDQQKKRDPNG